MALFLPFLGLRVQWRGSANIEIDELDDYSTGLQDIEAGPAVLGSLNLSKHPRK